MQTSVLSTVPGAAPGQSGPSPGPSPGADARREGLAPASGVAAVTGVPLFRHGEFGPATESVLDRGPDPFAEGPGRGRARDSRPGAPASAFLAQHIAQEVMPQEPGPDRYVSGTRAYGLARDSTVEILSASGRLDIRI